MRHITNSEKETFGLAKRFVAKLRGGEVLALIGELGAGKTAFVKGLAAGLGVKNIITSPTFVLMKEYKSKVKSQKLKVLDLVHIDAYRLNSGKDLAAIGALEYFGAKNSVVAIEWADRVKDIWPKKVIKIDFKILKDNKREITIKY